MRWGHPNVAKMACAAAHVREELRLVFAASSEEVVSTLAADALGLEGQGAFESLQLAFLLAGFGRRGFGCLILVPFVLVAPTFVLNCAGRRDHPLCSL